MTEKHEVKEMVFKLFKEQHFDGKKDPKMMLDWTQGQSVPMQVGCFFKKTVGSTP